MPSSVDVFELPSVLVLGGILEGTASAVLAYLWPSNTSKHRKASYIRIADKFLILPQSDTFLKWVHPDARKILKDGHGKGVEYMQANIVGIHLSYLITDATLTFCVFVYRRPLQSREPRSSRLLTTRLSI